MKHRLKIFIFSLAPILLTGILLIVGCSCGEMPLPLQIENQTDMSLTIYVQEHKAGGVEPHESVKIKGIPGTLTHYLIEAKNNEGEVIHSRKFSVSELHDADWKVVIPKSFE